MGLRVTERRAWGERGADRAHPAGLSRAEAARRLADFGPNELAHSERRGFRAQLLAVFREPMLAILVVIAVSYLALGDLVEGLILAGSAALILGITLYQNRKSEGALAALRELSSPRAVVVREGRETRIAARELVPGDLVLLREGDRVPADGELLDAAGLKVDESLLTGEGGGVHKTAGAAGESGRVFMSTLVIGGRASVRISATGPRSEVGQLGLGLRSAPAPSAALLREIRGLVSVLSLVGLGCCLTIVGLYRWRGAGWVEGALAGLATAMALIPEEFPVVVSVFLAFGAWRLSRANVLVRKADAIERLGAISVLCADKTGTMTKNEMELRELLVPGAAAERNGEALPAVFAELLAGALLASPRQSADPMERGILKAAEEARLPPRGALLLEKEYPLTEKRFATAFVWREGSGRKLAWAKGAPEAVAELCKVSSAERLAVERDVAGLAARGFRLLGVASADTVPEPTPAAEEEIPWRWRGLLAFADPLRAGVPEAVEKCRTAGVRVIMITGDHALTAREVARSIGLGAGPAVALGAEVESADEESFRALLAQTNVYARMRPAQKLRIVAGLQASGAVVAMTGDGVNDAPCLRRADVGIAMGAKGTDVAREAAGIVLLDDNFDSIVAGIERGRAIYRNLQRSLRYVTSIHVPLAGLALLPLLVGWEPLFYPVHIALIQLVVDPSCSLLFEAQEADQEVMRRPPRPPGTPLLGRRLLLRSFAQGALIFLPVALLYGWERAAHGGAGPARCTAVLTLMLANVSLIFADLSLGNPRALRGLLRQGRTWFLLGFIAAFTILAARVPAVARWLHFEVLGWDDLGKVVATAIAIFAITAAWNARGAGAGERD